MDILIVIYEGKIQISALFSTSESPNSAKNEKKIGQKSQKDTYMKFQMRCRTPLGSVTHWVTEWLSVSAKNAARLGKCPLILHLKKNLNRRLKILFSKQIFSHQEAISLAKYVWFRLPTSAGCWIIFRFGCPSVAFRTLKKETHFPLQSSISHCRVH